MDKVRFVDVCRINTMFYHTGNTLVSHLELLQTTAVHKTLQALSWCHKRVICLPQVQCGSIPWIAQF